MGSRWRASATQWAGRPAHGEGEEKQGGSRRLSGGDGSCGRGARAFRRLPTTGILAGRELEISLPPPLMTMKSTPPPHKANTANTTAAATPYHMLPPTTPTETAPRMPAYPPHPPAGRQAAGTHPWPCSGRHAAGCTRSARAAWRRSPGTTCAAQARCPTPGALGWGR